MAHAGFISFCQFHNLEPFESLNECCSLAFGGPVCEVRWSMIRGFSLGSWILSFSTGFIDCGQGFLYKFPLLFPRSFLFHCILPYFGSSFDFAIVPMTFFCSLSGYSKIAWAVTLTESQSKTRCWCTHESSLRFFYIKKLIPSIPLNIILITLYDFFRWYRFIARVSVPTAFAGVAHFSHLIQECNVVLVSRMLVKKDIALFELVTASILMHWHLCYSKCYFEKLW